jgi:DNA polymerase III, beta subunit
MLSFKFNTNSAFPSAVSWVAAHAKSTLSPIHRYLLLTVLENGVVKVEATNGAYFLNKSTRIESCQVAGKVCVDAAKFSSICQNIPNDQLVTVSINREQDKITGMVTAGRSKFKIMCMEAEMFPNPNLCEKKFQLKVSAAALAAALEKLNRVAPDKDARTILNCVCMEIDETGKCTLVASDGIRAAKAEFAGTIITPTAGPITILIPKQQVGQLTSTIGRSNNGQVVVLVDEARVAVIDPANGWRLQFAMLDGRYPDWRRVIPVVTERWSSLEVEREQLISSLERAKILSDSRLNAVSLNLAGGEISVSSQGVDGIEGAIEIISCTQKNRNGSIKFNVSYLINAVQSLVGSRVHMFMDLEAGNKASLIQSPDDATNIHVLTPIR